MEPIETDVTAIARVIFSEKVPFNHLLGLEVLEVHPDRARFGFSMRDELVGNFMTRILHGGVISAVLDALGGMVAFLGVLQRLEAENADFDTKLARFARLATIDLRVDYLRPGAGQRFVASGQALRTGRRICVVRTDLHNDRGDHIAAGTSTYVVG